MMPPRRLQALVLKRLQAMTLRRPQAMVPYRIPREEDSLPVPTSALGQNQTSTSLSRCCTGPTAPPFCRRGVNFLEDGGVIPRSNTTEYIQLCRPRREKVEAGKPHVMLLSGPVDDGAVDDSGRSLTSAALSCRQPCLSSASPAARK